MRLEGLRLYDWTRVALPWTCSPEFERWLLVRRNGQAPDQRAYYSLFAPKGPALAELAGAAGLCWTIEKCSQRALLDPPKTLDQLKADAKTPAEGYQIHHIVEEQADSASEDANSKRFGDDQLNGPDNLVRARQLAHEEISRWYDRQSRLWRNVSARLYSCQ